jgi:uncharacterized membrane protein YphA (DoxX/SURF4 family)
VKEWVGLLARLVTGSVWIAAGAAKVLDPAESVVAVRAYQLLPGNLAEPVGQLLPVIEIVVGATLVLGLLTRGSAVVSALLFVAFIVCIASVWARGISIDCGCFGGGGYDADATSKYPWEIARDVVLLITSLFVAWLPSTRLALDAALFGRAGDRAPEPEGS